MLGERVNGSCEGAWLATLAELLERGEEVPATKPSCELLGFDVTVSDPRCRTGENPVRPLAIVTAIARFVWMMAGDDRLEDIGFYEPRVVGFSDDGLTVPGSDYGARLRKPAPGLDQVAGAVRRLRGHDDEAVGEDGRLRRVANVVWRPEDAVRTSSDIPCAFGLFYFPRGGSLVTQLVMRSNNAIALLPFNLFEFTLLAEVVAVESGLALGPFRLDAMSMHLFSSDRERAADAIAAGTEPPRAMPPMPADPAPLDQLNLLARLEAKLRHEGNLLAESSAAELVGRAEPLDPYWRPFLLALTAHAAARAGNHAAARGLVPELPRWCAAGVATALDRMGPSQPTSQLALEGTPPRPAELVSEALRASGTRAADEDHIHTLLDEIEAAEGIEVTRVQARLVIADLLRGTVAGAARSDRQGGGPRDRVRFSLDEVRAALRARGVL
jgi:hypothetical protein